MRDRDTILFSGEIDDVQTWSADTVIVTGDILIEPGGLLQIAPGVCVLFDGFHQIRINGSIQAIGNPAERILFSSTSSDMFTTDQSTFGAWSGLRFIRTDDSQPPSILEYCIIEFSKGLPSDVNPQGAGGAVTAVDFSNLTVRNCIFRNNLAIHGGVFFLDTMSSPKIVNCLFYNNHVLGNAAVFLSQYSYPRLVNNTIIDNYIHNADNPYIETSALQNFHSKPLLINNIIRNNNPDTEHMHTQSWMQKLFYSWNNNIEGDSLIHNNIDTDPQFLELGQQFYALGLDSPGIDAGTLEMSAGLLPNSDLSGNVRVVNLGIDQGAYEFQAFSQLGDVNCDDDVDVLDIIAVVNNIIYGWEPSCFALMDLNDDSIINILDIVAMIQFILYS